LKEVRHVPDLKKNMISIGQLGGEGCVTTFIDKTWKVTKGSLVIAKGRKIGILYLCSGISNSINALTSIGEGMALRHHRLGKMSEKGMQILHSRNLLPGLKHVDLKFCENCVYGKQNRVRFLRVGKEKKSLCIQRYGDLLRYHLLVSLIIMLLLLMMQPEKPGFIVFKINMMYLILSRNGKLWLKMRQEKC